MRALLALVVAAAAVVATLAISDSRKRDPRPPAAPDAPNFIVVMSDDQALNTFTPRFMPRTFRHLVRGGTRVKTAYAIPPLCCPARAGFQTGQYPHNHGVFSNRPGFPTFSEPDSQIASWLQAAGYRTGFVGKYMNGFEQTEPAAGYDYWWGVMGRPHYTRYEVSFQGEKRKYRGMRSYITSKITKKSLRFIRKQSKAERPFFLWASHYAPHTRRSKHPACGDHAPRPLDRDWRRFRNLRMPKGPSFNERDVSDKPENQREPRLGRKGVRAVEIMYRCSVAAMQEVDRSVGRIVRTLKRLGELGRTVIVYISDNGHYFGEHRVPHGKVRPWEEALRVPMAVRVPKRVLGKRPARRIGPPITNIDLAPTFLELAKAEPCTLEGSCRVMDGRSFVDLLRGKRGKWSQRPFVLEIGNGCRGGYRGLRTKRYLYVQWYARTDACEVIGRELYDMRRDPHQLRNLLSSRALAGPGGERAEERAARLEERLERLRECRGVAGRDEPSDAPFCS